MTRLRWSFAAALSALTACTATPAPAPWTVLFDGTRPMTPPLGAFESSQFGGDGEVAVRDGAIQLGMGSPLTGITWTGTPPTGEYELEVVAARIDGTDFFCGLTFPIGEAHLTLILGGWGGAVAGLSCLDGFDASRNATRTLKHFETGRDYRVLVRVRAASVEVLLDGEPFLRADPRAHELSLRPEVELSKPLGLASFTTEAAVRSMRWRQL